jgi:hypothetical protein
VDGALDPRARGLGITDERIPMSEPCVSYLPLCRTLAGLVWLLRPSHLAPRGYTSTPCCRATTCKARPRCPGCRAESRLIVPPHMTNVSAATAVATLVTADMLVLTRVIVAGPRVRGVRALDPTLG